MSNIEIGLLLLPAIVICIYSGMHVPIALSACSFVGVWAIKGSPVLASKLLSLAAADTISSYIFGVVPLFVLMGLVVSIADIGKDTFEVANQIFRKVKGGLGVATVFANAIFAAITGISIASAAVFTKVAVPEMIRFGYTPRFAVGIVAGSSVLGMLIPPSLLLIIYGIIAEQSVGDLFLAGIGPGILLSFAYIMLIIFMAVKFPNYVGTNIRSEDQSEIRFGPMEIGVKLIPVVVLISLVLGGIYGGFFTPTEAGAVGALGSIVVTLAKKKMTWNKLWQVVIETGHVTASICFLIIAATMYTRMLALSGVPSYFGKMVTEVNLGIAGILALYIIIILIMGTILDSVSIMMIMIPMVLPVIAQFNLNLIWFGIVNVIAVEIGLLTPPLGIAAYVIKGTLDDQRISLGDIFAGAFPFALTMTLVLAVVMLFPNISLMFL